MSQFTVEAIRSIEELPEAPAPSSGFLTSEFWATAAVIVANLVGVFSMLGWVAPEDMDTIGTAIKAGVLGLGALVVNGALIFKYISSRVQVKNAAAADATTRLSMRAQIVTERMAMLQKDETERLRLGITAPPTA